MRPPKIHPGQLFSAPGDPEFYKREYVMERQAHRLCHLARCSRGIYLHRPAYHEIQGPNMAAVVGPRLKLDAAQRDGNGRRSPRMVAVVRVVRVKRVFCPGFSPVHGSRKGRGTCRVLGRKGHVVGRRGAFLRGPSLGREHANLIFGGIPKRLGLVPECCAGSRIFRGTRVFNKTRDGCCSYLNTLNPEVTKNLVL